MNLRFGITGKLLVWFLVIIAIFYGTILVLYINVQQVVRLSGSIVAKNYAIASGTKKMMETLLSFKRAGASGIITYFAEKAAQTLNG